MQKQDAQQRERAWRDEVDRRALEEAMAHQDDQKRQAAEAFGRLDLRGCRDTGEDAACSQAREWLRLYGGSEHEGIVRDAIREGIEGKAAREQEEKRKWAEEQFRKQREAEERARREAAKRPKAPPPDAGDSRVDDETGYVCCCDGTLSGCVYVHSGCCSHHHGVCACK